MDTPKMYKNRAGFNSLLEMLRGWRSRLHYACLRVSILYWRCLKEDYPYIADHLEAVSILYWRCTAMTICGGMK